MVNTRSMCPVCYREIDAEIFIGKHVFMRKVCPDHGEMITMVERDPVWWVYCMNHGSPEYYKGRLIDVTDACNLKCKYCYHSNHGLHRSVDSILSEVDEVEEGDPVMLTGGEPTLHPDLINILDRTRSREVWLLTNGVKMTDPDYFNSVTSRITHGDLITLGLSFHKESQGADIEVLNLCRSNGLKIGTTFCVVDDLSEIDTYLQLIDQYRDVINMLRIKAATNLWAETKVKKRIFTSDLVHCLEGHGAAIDETYNVKVNYAPMMWNGIRLALIAWYDKFNVDMIDSDCKPHYKAKDGSINDIVVTGLKNARWEYVHNS